MKVLEPDVVCHGGGALLSPSTGVLDSHSYFLSLLADAEEHGAILALNTKIDDARIVNIDGGGDGGNSNSNSNCIQLRSDDGTRISCQSVINSAGLSAHHVANLIHKPQNVENTTTTTTTTSMDDDDDNNNADTNATTSSRWKPPQQYFAKGTYFKLTGSPKPNFQHLIYPIPVPGGLGVHATIDYNRTSIKFGPDVEWIDPSIKYSDDIDLNPNPQRGDVFYDQVRKYWPQLQDGQLVEDYVGIRPKLNHPSLLTSSPNESLGFQDFQIVGSKQHGIPGVVHLFGIESPGLTSSMAIGDYVRDMILAE